MIVDGIPGIVGSLIGGSKFVDGKIFLRAISHFCSADNGILQSDVYTRASLLNTNITF